MKLTKIAFWTYLFIGETMLFPLAVAAGELEVTRKKEAKRLVGQPLYILKKGDTFSSVVKQLNLDVADLFALNPEFAELHMWKEGAVLYLPNTLPLPSLSSQGLLDIPTLAQTAPLAERITKELNTQGSRLAKSFDAESKSSHSSEKEKSYWSSRVKQHFEQEAEAYTERFLGGKGSARMQVSLDNSFNLDGLELDVLASLYENEDTLVFSQVGARTKNDRTIVNLGVGRREFNSEHMFGYNSFFDYDVTRSHSRFGAGVEYWQDHLKLGSNLYLPLSGWKDSPDFDYHEERPARGIDMRTQAYLPSHPQLSGKLSVERYWGEKVDLLGTKKTTKNPYAMTAGVEYQPMPFIKFTAGQTLARGGQHDTQVGIGLEWRLGASLTQMMTSSAPDRSLQGMRYDPVERNNNIVLEYREKVALAAKLPEMSGQELQPLTLSVNVQSRDPLAEVIWFGDVLGTASGMSQGSNTTLSLLSLPAAHADSANNSYPISVLIRDIKGREARADGVINVIEDNNIVTNFTLTVNGSSGAITLAPGQRYVLGMVVSDPRQTTLPAQASLFDIQTPELQYKVRFDGELNKYVVKDGDALYLDLPSGIPNSEFEKTAVAILPSGFEVRSNKLSLQIVQADLDSDGDGISDADEIANGTNPHDPNDPLPGGMQLLGGSLKVLRDQAKANGQESVDAQVVVVDANGVPKAGVTVTWQSESEIQMGDSSVTDASGIATISLRSLTAGQYSLKAQLGNHTLNSAVTFVADPTTAIISTSNLTILRDNARANGAETNIIGLKVTDATGNPLSHQRVLLHADNGAIIAPELVTGADGSSSMIITSRVAGASTVTATVAGRAISVPVTFIADNSTATIHSGDLTVVRSGALANGIDTNKVRVKVTDQQGNPLAGQSVTFTANGGATIDSLVTTASDGFANAELTSMSAGDSQVTVLLGTSQLHTTVSFVADTASAVIAQGALRVTSNGALADGIDTNAISVRVTDTNNNPLAGQVVNLSASNAVIASSVTTDSQGHAAATLTSAIAGNSVVTATLNGNTQNVVVMFASNSNTADIAQGDLTVTKDGAIANSVDDNRLSLRVTDAQGNPVPGQFVTLTASNGAQVVDNVTTAADGSANIVLTSNIAGPSTIRASVNGHHHRTNVQFVADASTINLPLNGGLTVLQNNAIANGSATNEVRVRVLDANNNPVVNQVVTLSATNGAIVTGQVTTGSDGTASATLTSVQAGHSTVTASMAGQSRQIDITFVADTQTAQIGVLAASKDNAKANGLDANSVSVTVTDVAGNPIPNVDVLLSASNGALVVPSVRTDLNGNAQALVTSLRAGNTSITSTFNGSQQSVGLTFMADDQSATITQGNLSVTNDNAKADGVAENQVSITVTDIQGNPLAGQRVSLSANNGAMIGASVTTGSNGVAHAPITSTHAGISTVIATIGSQQRQVIVQFVPDSNTATLGSGAMSVILNGAQADGTDTNAIRVRVSDANNNPLAGQVVSLSATNGAQIVSSATTGPDGLINITLTNTTAGNSTVSAAINGITQHVDVVFVSHSASADIAQGALSITKDGATADGQDENRVSLRVTDMQGNPVANQVVTLTATNGAQVVDSVTTAADGSASISLTSRIAGSSSVRASVNGNHHRINVQFVADIGSASLPLNGGLVVLKNNAIADGNAFNEIKVLVVDPNNNPVVNQAVTLSVDTNGAIATRTLTTGSDGTSNATLTSTVAGLSTVTATFGGVSRSAEVSFIADSTTATVSALTASRNNAKANGLDTNQVSVSVADAEGNPVTGQVVAFTASNGAVITSTAVTDASGKAEVILTNLTAGNSIVTANVNGQVQNVAVTFIADTATATITQADLNVDKNDARADGVDNNLLAIRVTDIQGNPLVGQQVTLVASNSAVIVGSVMTGSDGRVSVPVTSIVAGSTTITAAIGATQRQVNLNFMADSGSAQIAQGALRVTQSGALADGTDTNVISVRVSDANNNPLSGQVVTLSASNGATIASTVTTDSQGNASETLTNTTAGTSVVTATLAGGSTQSVNVIFAGNTGTATIAQSDLTVINDNAIADGTDSNTIKLKVTDVLGNPLAAQHVFLTASNGATISESVQTGSDGMATVPITSMQIGNSEVRASINGVHRRVNVTFIGDVASATIIATDIMAVKNQAKADGVDNNQVQLRVTDRHGNPLAGQVVSLTANNGASIASTVTTGTGGLALVDLTSQKAGSSVVTATLNGMSRSVVVGFIADASTATLQSQDLTVMRDNAKANGLDSNAVMVRVTDQAGNPLPYQVVALTASNGALITGSVVTGVNGTAQFIISSLLAGMSTISASINGVTQQVAVTFVADTSTATIAQGHLSVVRNDAKADGTELNEVSIKVTDKNGNPLVGQIVSLAASNGALLNNSSVTTAADGVANATISSTTSGETVVTATVNGSSRTARLNFVADTSSATLPLGSGLTIVNNDAVADGSATNEIQVLVVDGQGNPLANQTVMLRASNGAQIAGSITTGLTGVGRTTVTSTQAGLSTVTATVGGVSRSVDIRFVTDNQSATIVQGDLVVVNDNAKANGNDQNRVQIRVTDAQGNPVANQDVSLTADNGALVTGMVNSNINGTAEAIITNLKAGAVTLTATVNGQSQHVSMSFVADDTTATLAMGDVVVSVNGATANGVDTNAITIKVTDIQGNPLAGQSVALVADNGAVIASSVTTGADGRATATLTNVLAGSSNVAVRVGSTTRHVVVDFVPDSSTAQINQGELLVEKNGAMADGTDSNVIRVRVSDANNNPLASQVVSLSANNGATVISNVTTDSQGNASAALTSTTAGTSSVMATVNGVSRQVDVLFVAQSGTADIASGDLTVVKDNARADGVALNELSLKVTDAQGNPVNSQWVVLTASNGAVVRDSSGAVINHVTTDSNGMAMVSLSNIHSGSSTVRVSVNGRHHVQDVMFVANTATATLQAVGGVSIVKDNALANGTDTNEIQIKVVDAHNNPVAGQVVGLAATNGATIGSSVTTGTNGLATVSLHNSKAGPSTITATLGGISRDVTVNFVANPATATIAASGGVLVVRNNARANGLDTNLVRVSVQDLQGNLLANQQVTLTATNNALIANSVITRADGTAEAIVSNLVAGNVSITATVNGVSQQAVMAFIGDTGTATIAQGNMTIVKNNAKADGSDENRVSVLVTDVQGNPLANEPVTLSVNNSATVTNGLGGSNVTVMSDGSGSIIATLRNIRMGSTVLTATVGNGQQREVTTTFVADTATARVSDLTVLKASAVANGNEQVQLQAKVTDAHGNALNRYNVTLAASNGATLSSSSMLTGTDGMINFSLTHTRTGVSTVTATANGQSRNADVNFTAGHPVLANSSFTLSKASIESDGSDSTTLITVLRDANNNLVTGANVTFVDLLNVAPTAELSFSAVTQSNGTYSASLRGSYTGNVGLGVIADGQSVSGLTQTVTLLQSIDLTKSTFTASKGTLIANGTDSSQLVLTLRDSSNRPVSGLGNIGVAVSGVANTRVSAVTENNGVYSVTLTGLSGGTASIRPQRGGVNIGTFTQTVALSTAMSPTLSNLVFVDVANNRLAVPNAGSDLTSTGTLLLNARDYAGTPITSGALIRMSNNNNVHTLSGLTHLGSGSYRATYNTGTVNSDDALTVSYDGVTLSGLGLTVDVVAGAPSPANFVVTSPTTLVVGDPATFSVLIRDIYNNPLTVNNKEHSWIPVVTNSSVWSSHGVDYGHANHNFIRATRAGCSTQIFHRLIAHYSNGGREYTFTFPQTCVTN